MKFEYEISLEDYVASQILCFKLRTRPRRFKSAAFWIVSGAVFIFVAWDQKVPGWAPMLLAVTGAWWIYVATRSLFPGWYFRRYYPGAGLSGKKFQAELNEEGFEVAGNLCAWRVSWPGVSVKGETQNVFVFYGANTLFMFGKKYLTDEQQGELRKMAGLPIVEPT